MDTSVRHSTSSYMPTYRAVLAVDAEKYSRASSRHQRLLNQCLLDSLGEAFNRSGLAEQWRTAAFPQHTGDGYLVGVEPPYLPLLVYPLLDELQAVLAAAQPQLAAEDRSLRLRLRAALGIGPLPDSGGTEAGDGIGTPMNETHRVLDSPVLRRALDDSDPDTTFLAAGLTGRVYDDAVLGGYVALNPSLFHPVTAELPDKNFRAEAFIYVPRPSTRPTQTDTDADQPQPPGATTAAGPSPIPGEDGSAANTGNTPAAHTLNTVRDVSGRAVQEAHAGGNINLGDQTSVDTQNNLGGITGNVGTVVNGTATNVNTGSGHQVNHLGPRHGTAPSDEGDQPTRDGE
ncbi:hypothetical protein RIF23_04985 [Lipingzhangella sp. LS1_29]|uniref:Uncharacterized protein n=1 Tax=Lipingzhangella rawalii TaxID=2055835 RepID=A0ABU2H4V6_9ACTN|nr:hypothetical protein [Lipingzhangella rawalii]MDS1269644.1 hypothetical protein [Lipingzhangella rawalii]